MSNIGLNSNIYHSTRAYLDLLNNYLIDFNYAKEIGKNYTNDKVTEFFKRLSDKSKVDPEVRMIRSFFNSFYKERKKDTDKELIEIVEELQKPEPNTEVLREIEELVDVLKFQCAESYARMKGTK
jgi:hypothetical protein